MKLLIIACAFLAFVSAKEQVIFKIPPASLTKLHTFALPCAEKYNLDISIIHKLGEATLPRDEATNKFLHCYAVSSGFVKEDGHMVIERLAGVIGDHPLIEEFKEELRKCDQITKEDPIASVTAKHICYAENSPILYAF